jgi:hypothetical protein
LLRVPFDDRATWLWLLFHQSQIRSIKKRSLLRYDPSHKNYHRVVGAGPIVRMYLEAVWGCQQAMAMILLQTALFFQSFLIKFPHQASRNKVSIQGYDHGPMVVLLPVRIPSARKPKLFCDSFVTPVAPGDTLTLLSCVSEEFNAIVIPMTSLAGDRCNFRTRRRKCKGVEYSFSACSN